MSVCRLWGVGCDHVVEIAGWKFLYIGTVRVALDLEFRG